MSVNIPLVDLHIPAKLRPEIDAKIKSLLDRAAYIGGEEVELFAKEFAAYCGGGTCVPVANGTDALILALKALGIGRGDEVITVPFTFIATTEAITAVGATIKLVDVHPKNFTIDIAQLEKAITPKTKAVIPVHLFGHPCDMDPLMAVAKKHKLFVIEDAAQAHGAEYKNKRIGSFGDVACFSFYPTKNLGGCGDGGATICRTDEVAKKLTQYANHGRSAQYFHDLEGYNSRLDSIQAAILRVLLRNLDDATNRRLWVANEYTKAIVESPYMTAPVVEPYAKHVFHLYCVLSDRRDALMSHLKSKGVSCGVYYPLPLHLQPAYFYLGLQRGAFPISERLSERILALPMHAALTNEDVERVKEALLSFN